MGWPQILVIILLTSGVIVHMCWHGRSRDDNYHWPSKLVATAVWAGLLYWGGFFG